MPLIARIGCIVTHERIVGHKAVLPLPRKHGLCRANTCHPAETPGPVDGDRWITGKGNHGVGTTGFRPGNPGHLPQFPGGCAREFNQHSFG